LLTITEVEPSSPASFAGLEPKDRIVSCAGYQIDDWLDFARAAAGFNISLVVKRSSIERCIQITRRPGVQWGMHFEGENPSVCRCRCIFCFVDQLPPDARASLKVKDDDVKYSFYQGTYISLSMEQAEYAVKKELSPIHVSVHSTNPELRGRIMGAGRDLPILPRLKLLSEAGIKIETQIVVVPGWNDGDELGQTIADLIKVEGVSQLGVVPVGLTRHRDGLTEIRCPDKSESGVILDVCEKWQKKALELGGTFWIYAADEFYRIAERQIPSFEYYEDCTLQANGIGLLRNLLDCDTSHISGSGTLYCGSMVELFMNKVLKDKRYRIVPVENKYLGETVTVSGLMAGSDVARAVDSDTVSDGNIYLPAIMFNDDGIAIDGWSIEDIERETERDVTVITDLEQLC